jgi:hypothetical protein
VSGVAVVGSGNYSLEIDTGFLLDAFILDTSQLNGVDVLNGTTSFAEVLDGCTNVNVKRGRRDQGDQFSAGTMTFTMLDTSGIFNPFDEQSPYWNSQTQKPGLAPMRKVRLSRYDTNDNKEYLFTGYIVNYDYNFALGGIDTVTVYCADDFYLLAQTYFAEFNVSEQISSERLSAVLDLPEVAFPIGQRDIATGSQTLGGSAAYTIDDGTNVLEYCSRIQQAEQGRLFMSRQGDITFDARLGNTLSGSIADFHDDGTNFKYNGVGITFEADQVVNRASVTIAGGNTPQVAEDLSSQSVYFIQTESITESLLHNNSSALTLANYLLSGEPEARYTSVQTQFNMLTTAQRDSLTMVDIGATITVEKTFASGAGTTELAQELAIEGIEHSINISNGHSIALFTSPTTIVFELILDDALYGTISTTNCLG